LQECLLSSSLHERILNTVNSRVLVAESDRALARYYGHCLRREGYDVHFACDGLDCWKRLHELRPAVLLLEWELPWGGGDGVLARLREDWSGAEVFVALTTRVDLATDGPLNIPFPVQICLRKPVRLAALKAAMQDARGHLHSVIRLGQPVRISRGPLAGLAGRIRNAPTTGRWLVEIAWLGQGVYCRISPDCLESIQSLESGCERFET
jgi:CheY-like chemotaxis protein